MQRNSGLENRHVDARAYQDTLSAHSGDNFLYYPVFQKDESNDSIQTVIDFPGKPTYVDPSNAAHEINLFSIDLWISLLLLGAFAAITLLKNKLRCSFSGFLLMGSNPKTLQESERRQIDRNDLSISLLNLVSCLLTTIIVYVFFLRNSMNFDLIFDDKSSSIPSHAIFFALIGASVFGYFALKIFFLKIFGTTFHAVKKMNEYRKNYKLFLASFSLVSFFIALIVCYAPHQFISISLITIVLYLLVMNIIRLFSGQNKIISFLNSNDIHIFLYLCTLEFLPLFVLGKFFHIHVT